MAKTQKQHRHTLPGIVPLLLILCLAGIAFSLRPQPVSAQDRAVVTRIREFFPKDSLLEDTELYYPQLSFGGNPNELQTANAMMREYAIRQYRMYRQHAKTAPGDPSIHAADTRIPATILSDYQIQRNGGGYFSATLYNPAASLDTQGFCCFTVRLSDQTVCRLADLFLSGTDYCSLLNQQISQQLQQPFEQVRHDTLFYLSEDGIVLLFPDPQSKKLRQYPVSLSEPTVARTLAPWLRPVS